MNILAIDYGTKRIGLAWVQEGLDVVLPFGVVENEEPMTTNKELKKIVTDEKINKIIIGMPLGLDGKENENTVRIRAFIDGVKSILQIPIEIIDERFSSQAADRLGATGASRDEKAAMILLQNYLDKKV